jgi:putative transposase
VDYGPKFISRDLDLSADWIKVPLDFSLPGKPTDDTFIKSFNGRLRAECVNERWFLSLKDAQNKLGTSRKVHNEQRPHSSLGNRPPGRLRGEKGLGLQLQLQPRFHVGLRLCLRPKPLPR